MAPREEQVEAQVERFFHYLAIGNLYNIPSAEASEEIRERTTPEQLAQVRKIAEEHRAKYWPQK